MNEPTAWYFAYGANMCREAFVERRGMRPLSVEAARLDDYQLSFGEPGVPFIEPGFGTIEPKAGAEVHGGLYLLFARDLTRLHRSESANYARLELDVDGEDAGTVSATVYSSRHVVPGRLPSRRYLGLLQRGAEELGLPQSYRDMLAAHPCCHVPVLSALAERATPLYGELRERGVRPEIIGIKLRELWKRWR